MQLKDSMDIAAAGMQAQGARLRIVAENIANSDSTAKNADGSPYRRKVIMFENVLNKKLGYDTVKVGQRGLDKTDFAKRFEPGHPSADAEGYVTYPNVNPVVEMMDMREARRGYEANLNVVEVSKSMLTQTLELLR